VILVLVELVLVETNWSRLETALFDGWDGSQDDGIVVGVDRKVQIKENSKEEYRCYESIL
jgi:hypothetical protein